MLQTITMIGSQAHTLIFQISKTNIHTTIKEMKP